MKLTAEDVAKATKLSVATVRVYAVQKKIGTKEGNKRFFTKADLKKFTASGPSGKRSARPKTAKKVKPMTKREVKEVLHSQPEPKPARRSFLDFFLNRKPQRKVSISDLAKR
jgi:Helix-turn-helix domain